jgi:hypothetical protein
MAVWLFSTDSFGLESTRSVPKFSSSLMAVRKSPRRKARLNSVFPTAEPSVEVDVVASKAPVVGLTLKLRVVVPWPNARPAAPWLKYCQSMPC